MKLTQNQLTTAAMRILSAAGTTTKEAECVAKRLVNANLVGYDSHGVIRLCQYVDQLREGTIKSGSRLTVVAEFGAVRIFDAGLGFGQVMAEAAVKKGIEVSRSFGVSTIGLRNVAHVGRVGDWAEMSADEGIISLHFVNSPAKPGVTPYGGRERRMATNPICIGIPVPGKNPVVVDISTSAVAEGKLRVAHAAGCSIPEGWIIDKHGKPSTNPGDYYDGGAILPMGGHKGYGLSLAVDLLAGAFTGGGATTANKSILRNNMLSVFIDPNTYGMGEEASSIATSYLDWIKKCKALNPDSSVLIPGEPEIKTRDLRRQNGIEVPEGVWQRILQTAKDLGLSQAQILTQTP